MWNLWVFSMLTTVLRHLWHFSQRRLDLNLKVVVVVLPWKINRKLSGKDKKWPPVVENWPFSKLYRRECTDQNNSFTQFYVPWKIEPHFKKLSSQKFKSFFVKVQWIQFACFNWEMNEGMWFIWGHHCHSQLGTVDLKTDFFALFCTLLRDVCQPTLYRVTPQQLNPMTD